MITILQEQNAVKESLETISQTNNNLWIWICAFEAICIIGLLLILLRKQQRQAKIRQQFITNAKKEKVDFDNVIISSFHAGDLYNQLKKVCHPDRFSSDPELTTKADSLFQQITQNKHDLKKLQELKTKAVQELHVNI